MEVSERKTERIPFGSLDRGDVFKVMEYGEMYMKIGLIMDSKIDAERNAVNIRNGDLVYADPGKEVFFIKGKFVEE